MPERTPDDHPSTYWLEGTERSIGKLPAHKTVGILSGSFDPFHEGHLGIAQNCLKATLGPRGVDKVLFYLHSFSPGKNPAPYDFRLQLIKQMIKDRPGMGVLIIDEAHREDFFQQATSTPWGPLASEAKSIRGLFSYMRSHSRCEFCRIVGADRWEDASKEKMGIVHYVATRGGHGVSGLPHNFFVASEGAYHHSSTDIRRGLVPLPPAYQEFSAQIARYYPNARF